MLKLGLSACVWGHPNKKIMPGINQGSIPMCMGPPAQTVCYDIVSGVYPHVYGATWLGTLPQLIPLGLSPCVWGHPNQEIMPGINQGSIPMCMGPPFRRGQGRLQKGVYPHVYEATLSVRSDRNCEMGLSRC